ncbi:MULTISPECIES: hypothetical protein [unclassified Pseudomonas]|uniref:hypothetical protein n=1 Tax=unclassified Pseudomonas TaxID=196821 RepID=UPI000A1F834E|nr:MULTISPECIES: hypothetical protein [unclassified Pseudomonas]
MTVNLVNFDELAGNLSSLSFNVANINKLFTTTTLYEQLLKEDTINVSDVSLDKRERFFTTTNPIFLRRIHFTGANQKGIELVIYTSEGTTRTVSVPPETRGASVAIINEFCVKFSIKTSNKLSKPTLRKIDIFGFNFINIQKTKAGIQNYITANNNIAEFIKQARSEVSDLQASHDELTAKSTSLAESIETLTTESAELSANVNKEMATLGQVKASIKESESDLNKFNAEIEAKRSNAQQLDRERKILNDEIASLKQELSSLVNDRSVISDEFTDYVKEGKAQARIYLALMILPCLTIGLCAFLIHNGASNLVFTHYAAREDMIAALLLRIPLAVALGAAIYYSWLIGSAFLRKIFSIQEERLTLAKLLVLAKNTVFSTAEDLGIDPKEKFYLRTRLKIELLKSHLAKDIGSEMRLMELEKMTTPLGKAQDAEDEEPETEAKST